MSTTRRPTPHGASTRAMASAVADSKAAAAKEPEARRRRGKQEPEFHYRAREVTTLKSAIGSVAEQVKRMKDLRTRRDHVVGPETSPRALTPRSREEMHARCSEAASVRASTRTSRAAMRTSRAPRQGGFAHRDGCLAAVAPPEKLVS